MKERGHPDGPPPTVSDGRGGIREAMAEVYGKVPEYSGRGRPPSEKQVQRGRKYPRIVKQRDGKGKFCGTRPDAVYGDIEELIELFGKSTAYVERTHLTMRTFSSRPTRKSTAFSKKIGMYKARAALEDMYYNLIRPHKTPRLRNENGIAEMDTADSRNGGGTDRSYMDDERTVHNSRYRRTTLDRVTAQD